MNLVPRSYAGPDDIHRLQAFNAAAISAVGQCGYLHPGDIPHRLFNGMRRFEPSDVLSIFELRGELAAWMMVYPPLASFDLQIAPGRRDPSFERGLLGAAERELQSSLAAHGLAPDEMIIDVFEEDRLRMAAVSDAGWTRGNEPYVVTRTALRPLPAIELPPGYQIRNAAGIVEAKEISEVHAASFGSDWTEALYRKVMLSPGYDPLRELLAVAPDGSFAGFCVLWYDQVNKTGLFEPVGTHPNHRRIGIGRALLAAGMREMDEAGLDTAIVMYEDANPASGQLYRGMGFVPAWRILDWHKPVPTPDSN